MLASHSWLQELTGLSLATPPGGLQTLAMEPVSEALGEHWGSTTRHVLDGVLSNDAAMASPLVRAAAFRSLVTAFVEAFDTNVVGTGRSSDVGALPSTVRRALAFVEEHAHDDIGVVGALDLLVLLPDDEPVLERRHARTASRTPANRSVSSRGPGIGPTSERARIQSSHGKTAAISSSLSPNHHFSVGSI